jgi:uncharacterized protein YukE
VSEQRVVATGAALRAAQEMRALVNRLQPMARQVMADGQRLSRPDVWDGATAAHFRQAWSQHGSGLTRTVELLQELDGQAVRVIQDIMRAGSTGQLGAPPPAPKPPEHHGWGGWGWVHAGLAIASFIPVVGTAASLIDAGIYLAQGDYLDAGISAVGAIPLIGEGADALKAGRLAVAGARALEDTSQVVRIGEEGVRAFQATEDGARAIDAGDGAVQGLDRLAGIGRSSPTELTAEQAQQVTREFQDIGGDADMLRVNEGARTGYVDSRNVINVRGDVFPNPEGTTANATLSSRAALAHELGHANFNVPEGDPAWLPPGNVDDEARASIWAAQNVPNLSLDERVSLIMDAQQRGGVIPDAYRSFIDDTMESYWTGMFGGGG